MTGPVATAARAAQCDLCGARRACVRDILVEYVGEVALCHVCLGVPNDECDDCAHGAGLPGGDDMSRSHRPKRDRAHARRGHAPARDAVMTIRYSEEPETTLRMRTELATGRGPKGEIEASLNIDGRAIIVRYGGRQFVVNTLDIVSGVIDAAEGREPT